MKKILGAFAVAAVLTFTACEPSQPPVTETPITVNLSSTSMTTMGLSSNTKSMTLTVSNTESKDATIKWELEPSSTPPGWTTQVNNNSATEGTITVPANGSVDVMLAINPNNNAGSTMGKLEFYDEADESGTKKEFSYEHTALDAYFTLADQGSLSGSSRSQDPPTDYKIWIINNNSVDVNMRWERTNESANPSAWQLPVCTDALCFTPADLTKPLTVPAGDSVDFKITVDAQSTTGTGGSTVLFYVPADSANSVVPKVISHQVTL